ncbi:MAG: NosD domain-containing protein, partial [Candidatus Hodarchaeota archaeon]
DHNTITNNNIIGNAGDGYYSVGSDNNEINSNEVKNNGENGILLENSDFTSISNNLLFGNYRYGTKIDSMSSENGIFNNDFIRNNIQGTSQGYDDGSNNEFTLNFFDDHDNTDEDGDGVADNPYSIDGSANNSDSTPSSTPSYYILIFVKVNISPSVIDLNNTKKGRNDDKYLKANIKFPKGYSAYDANISTILISGGIPPLDAEILNNVVLKVKFNKTAVIEHLKSLNLENPRKIYLNITGFMNGGEIMFQGSDIITVIDSSATPGMIGSIILLSMSILVILRKKRKSS